MTQPVKSSPCRADSSRARNRETCFSCVSGSKYAPVGRIFEVRRAATVSFHELKIHVGKSKSIPLRPTLQGGQASAVLGMVLVQPRDDDRSIDENHGRVRRRSSAPEISPVHVPARALRCSTTA